MNFRNFGNEQLPMEGGGGSGRPPGNFPLARQGSIYSLTFDELQNTMGSIGKDFGSMNMDELLKSIWNAEETQTMGGNSHTVGVQDGGFSAVGPLQRQGSLTLPRTISQKTVDEVWKDISKEHGGGGGGGGGGGFGEATFPQRQQTLGEMTLEEFLVKAGVVREENQLGTKPNDTGLFGSLVNSQNNPGFSFGLQNTGRNTGVMGSRVPESSNQIAFQSGNLPLGVNGVRSAQQQHPQMQQQQQPQHNQQQQLFPKQPTLSYAAMAPTSNNGPLGSPVIRSGIAGISDPAMNGGLIPSATLQGGGMGMASLGTGAVTVATGSPTVSSDGIGKSNGDASSVSPAPYVFSGVLRGRKCSAVEKVVERRQRRMIKNRESAARSRARKQAYTTELEAEVAKLKEQNQELRRKQAELIDMQKNQVMEMMNVQQGVKRRCFRRTQSGPW